jgi:tetratricopeptide (TPR) repeat protein
MPNRYLDKSRLLRERGEGEEALQTLLEGERQFPNDARFPAQRALLLNDLGQHTEALKASWEALARDGCTEVLDDALFARAVALLMLRQLEEALPPLEELLARTPNYPNAGWLRAGMIRQRLGDQHPDTLAAYDAALEAAPDNLYMLTERADILRALGRYEEARNTYAALCAPEICPDEELRAEVTFKLGCVAMVMNDNETARDAFYDVLEIAPDYPDARSLYDLLS